MPSNHLILCRPLLLCPLFPSIRVFSSGSVLCIRWPKYFSFNISPSNEHPGLISFRMDWLECVTLLQRDSVDQVKDPDVGRLLWPLWVSYESLYKRQTGGQRVRDVNRAWNDVAMSPGMQAALGS